MRIGINLLFLIPGVVGGTETYASGLLDGLAEIDQSDEFFIFVSHESEDWPLPNLANFHRIVCPVLATSRWRRYSFEQFRLPKLLRDYRVDIVHSLGYVSPLLTSCTSIVTVPDLNYRAFGTHMPLGRRLSLAFFVRQSALRTSRVITISDFSQSQIVQAFKMPVEKVVVTYLGTRFSKRTQFDQQEVNSLFARLDITAPYCLAFGNLGVNKNIPRLVEAFARAKTEHLLRHQLVLVGHLNPQNLVKYVGDLDPNAVRVTGYLDDHSLQVVLSKAQVLIVPSLYEGFGLPVLEAMSNGVAVVCSDVAALPEVAGEAAVFFDPRSPEDMADKIAQVANDTDLQGYLRQKGFENLKRFSWEKTARKTLEVYKEVYGKHA